MQGPWKYIPDAISDTFCRELWNELFLLIQEHSAQDDKAPLHNPHFVYCSKPAGRNYKYFTTDVKGQAFPASLAKLATLAETIIKKEYKKTCPFNAAFINWYPCHKVHIPWHRDKTHKDFFIASFSLQEIPAESRLFSICNDQTQEVLSFPLKHCSLLIMEPGMQEAYQHSVPPAKEQKGRLNITLRMEL